MPSGEGHRKFAIVGRFNVETARELAHREKPSRPPRPGFRWVLREWIETDDGEVTAYAQWVEAPVE